MQTRMIYVGYNYPLTTEQAQDQAKSQGLVPWDRTTPGAVGPQGYVLPNFTGPAPRGTMVVFHGNGEFAWMRPNVVEAIRRRGFRVFLYEYPGYGGRPGKPSEAVIVSDARALVLSLQQAGDGPIYLWGQSLGSGVAAAVCADPELKIAGLALITPFDTLPNTGQVHYPFLPVHLLMIDQYNSVANLQNFKGPICMIRGDGDIVVPPALSLNLYAHLPGPKKMILQTGYGHGDWPDSPELSWYDDALDFIAPKQAP